MTIDLGTMLFVITTEFVGFVSHSIVLRSIDIMFGWIQFMTQVPSRCMKGWVP